MKVAIKKMYAQPVSIAGYTSACKWGIFHINIKSWDRRKLYFTDIKLGNVHTHETEFKAGNYIKSGYDTPSLPFTLKPNLSCMVFLH